MSAARYLPHTPFHAALKTRVDEYFERTRQSPRHAKNMLSKTSTLFIWLIGSYLYCLLGATHAWQVALGCVSIGLAIAAIGFNVQHDGAHGAYAQTQRNNLLAAAALDFIGGSSYIWSWKHNVFHHSNPNFVGLDSDIDIQPFCRLAPGQSRRPWQRAQHFYVWALYGLLVLKWMVDDVRDLFNGTIGLQRFPRPKGWKLAQLLAGKVFFAGWSIVLPLMLHPAWSVAAAWLFASIVSSVVMSTVFQMAHAVDQAAFPDARAAAASGWAEHQVHTATDFGQGNALLTWYIGALNFQIEHHLFPKVSHFHLPALAPIVRATCEEFGVRYYAHPSASAALASHVRWLRALGAA